MEGGKTYTQNVDSKQHGNINAVFDIRSYQSLCKQVQQRIISLTSCLEQGRTLIQQSQVKYKSSVKLPIKVKQFQSKLSILLDKKDENAKKLDQLVIKNRMLKNRMYQQKQITKQLYIDCIQSKPTKQAFQMAQCKAKIKFLIKKIKQKLYPLHMRANNADKKSHSDYKQEKPNITQLYSNASQLYTNIKQFIIQYQTQHIYRSQNTPT